MPQQRTDATNQIGQTGSVYKVNIDATTAALAGIWGKRRNVNGQCRINQLVSAVAISTAWQYALDMWEFRMATNAASGNFGQIADANFPGGVALGTSGLGTSGAVQVGFRTKIESAHCRDIVNGAAPFKYPVSAPANSYIAISCLAYQDSGAPVAVTPKVFSADAQDNFAAMTNSVAGNAITLPSGQVTRLVWDGAANAIRVDNLTDGVNGLCIELDFAMPTGLSAKNLRIADVQIEGGQVASDFAPAHIGDELERCQRYYAKTFPLGTAPAQNAGTAGALPFTQGVAAATAQKGNLWEYPIRMIKAPSLTLFNPSAANAQARNLDTGTDCSSTAVDALGASEWGVPFNVTTPSGSAQGQRLAIHLVADARL
ncbi:MAG TPA: hypothetical protein VMG55_09540 [Stellaceae bacterium]|nr:hypothetical protein [Stellaceae bacterium]